MFLFYFCQSLFNRGGRGTQCWPLWAGRKTEVNTAGREKKPCSIFTPNKSPPVGLSMCVKACICMSVSLFYLFVNMSVRGVTGTCLFPLWLCLLMSLKTAKLKVPLLVPEGTGSEYDSLTALISVLDTNSGTDAPGQSLVSLEPR